MEEDQEDVEESLPHIDKLTLHVDVKWHFDHAIQSNAIFEGKIAQLCALVKSTIFIVANSNFEIVYFDVIFLYYVETNFAL